MDLIIRNNETGFQEVLKFQYVSIMNNKFEVQFINYNQYVLTCNRISF